ncbi:MAG: type VII toxin-antitoxin system MntA family adenylyltransferase antitoxin [Methylococcales bacterium]
MNTDRIEDNIRTFFATRASGLVCAYLFGSVARGESRPGSDVDLATLYQQEPPATLEGLGFDLAGDLERQLGREVDMVCLNRASVDLIHRILRDGIIVLDRDPSARIRFEVKARNEYLDFRPILDRYRRVSSKSGHG